MLAVSLDGSPGHPILNIWLRKISFPSLTLFEAHLTVSDLDRAVAFYKTFWAYPWRVCSRAQSRVLLDWRSRQGNARSLGGGNHADEFQPPCGLPSCAL